MVHQRRRFGNWGEDAAVRYLKTRGYEILDRNYRSSWGEIDIIARQRDVLAFVEVKTRQCPEIRPSGCGRNPGKTDSVSGKPPGATFGKNQVFRYRSRFEVSYEILDLYGKNFSESFEKLFLKSKFCRRSAVNGQLPKEASTAGFEHRQNNLSNQLFSHTNSI